MSISERCFCGMLGLERYKIGELVTIRGKQYRFPSWTHFYDASQHGISEYKVHDEIPPKQT